MFISGENYIKILFPGNKKGISKKDTDSDPVKMGPASATLSHGKEMYCSWSTVQETGPHVE